MASDKNLPISSQTKETQREICGLRQPVDHDPRGAPNRAFCVLRKDLDHGFASPAFTGFAFVGLLPGDVSTKFHNRAFQSTFKIAHLASIWVCVKAFYVASPVTHSSIPFDSLLAVGTVLIPVLINKTFARLQRSFCYQ